MVTEFCGFNKGVIGKKLPSDSTLKNMRKEELINLLRLAQHNYENLMWFYNNAVKANMAQLNNNGWIPCSERLPEVEADVLLSLRSLDVYTGFRANTEGCFYVEGEGYVVFENVLAWMPLPAPFKEGE